MNEDEVKVLGAGFTLAMVLTKWSLCISGEWDGVEREEWEQGSTNVWCRGQVNVTRILICLIKTIFHPYIK